jgi:hypothetical protein
LETLRTNDKSLKTGLARWLQQQGKLPDPTTFDRWLDNVSESMHSQRQVGNPDMASFKEWFLGYLQSDAGLTSVRSRIAVESFGIPEPLRECLATILQREPQRFWDLYGLLTALPQEEVVAMDLIPRLRQFMQQSALSNCLLEEVSAQNHAANDAMAPAWDEILAPGSPTLSMIERAVQTGSSLSDLYGLVALTLGQTLAESNLWAQIRPILTSLFPDTTEPAQLLARFQESLAQEGSASAPTIHRLLADPMIHQQWQCQLLQAVNFLNKGYILSDFILHRTELLPYWKQGVVNAVMHDPQVARTMLESLTSRRVGDEEWQDQVGQLHHQLARIIVEDRVLFESLLTHKNPGFASHAEKTCPGALEACGKTSVPRA